MCQRLRPARGLQQLADLALAEAGQLDRGPADPPQRLARGEQDEQAPARQPAGAVGQQPERRLVGPLDVVDHEHARHRPGRRGRERLPHAVEEARLRGRTVQRRGRGGAQIAQQPRRLAERALADRRHPCVVLAQPPAQRFDQRAVGERRLLLVGAPAQAPPRRAPAAPPPAPRPAASCRSPPRPRAARRARRPRSRRRRRAAPPTRAPARPAARAGAAPRRHHRRGGGRLQRPLADRLVQPRRLLQRRHAQLARQRAHALAVLGERRGAVALLRVEPDQRAVRRLVQRVELEPAPRHREVARRLDQARQHQRQLAPQPVGLGALPVLERGRVAQPEALEEVAAEHGRRVAPPAPRPRRPGSVDIDPQPGAAHERDAVARRVDEVGADRGAQRRQRPPQRPARVLGVVLGPQQLGQHVARPRAGRRAPGPPAARPPCGCRTPRPRRPARPAGDPAALRRPAPPRAP